MYGILDISGIIEGKLDNSKGKQPLMNCKKHVCNPFLMYMLFIYIVLIHAISDIRPVGV